MLKLTLENILKVMTGRKEDWGKIKLRSAKEELVTETLFDLRNNRNNLVSSKY